MFRYFRGQFLTNVKRLCGSVIKVDIFLFLIRRFLCKQPRLFMRAHEHGLQVHRTLWSMSLFALKLDGCKQKEEMARDMPITGCWKTSDKRGPKNLTAFLFHVNLQLSTPPEEGGLWTTESSKTADPNLNPVQVAQTCSQRLLGMTQRHLNTRKAYFAEEQIPLNAWIVLNVDNKHLVEAKSESHEGKFNNHCM